MKPPFQLLLHPLPSLRAFTSPPHQVGRYIDAALQRLYNNNNSNNNNNDDNNNNSGCQNEAGKKRAVKKTKCE